MLHRNTELYCFFLYYYEEDRVGVKLKGRVETKINQGATLIAGRVKVSIALLRISMKKAFKGKVFIEQKTMCIIVVSKIVMLVTLGS